jgi:tRNA A37 methylthiotransferase MiaB
MKRPGAVEKTLERVHKWREICPDLAIRSTFIVGFPARRKPNSKRCSTSSMKRSSTA